MRRSAHCLLAAITAATLVFALVACGDDSGSSSSTTSGSSTGTTLSKTEVEQIQTQLNAVGCFAGTVDGVEGPETVQAIKDFQSAKGLAVDGVVGPDTQKELDEAVDANETVCAGSGGATTTSGAQTGDTVEVQAEDFQATFTVTSCESSGEASISLHGEDAEGVQVVIDASNNNGTIKITGGDAAKDQSGTVDSVQVGDDGTFNVGGVFANEADFLASGTCPAG